MHLCVISLLSDGRLIIPIGDYGDVPPTETAGVKEHGRFHAEVLGQGWNPRPSPSMSNLVEGCLSGMPVAAPHGKREHLTHVGKT